MNLLLLLFAFAPVHRVDLQWQISSAWQVVGYNVYRASNPNGPWSQINTSLLHRNTFQDFIVASGQTYWYGATAVDASGNESDFSNEVQATIP